MNKSVIRFRIHGFMVKHKMLLQAYKFFHNLSIHGYDEEMERRKGVSLFDYNELIKPVNKPWMDFVPDNNKYGMNYVLKDYMGIPVNHSIDGIIEHGLYLGDYVDKDEYLLNVKDVITFGDTRIHHLKEKGVDKRIVPIGPYIHYAKRLLDDQDFNELKQRLGKVLLVFPSHSMAGGEWSEFNMKELCEEIKRIGQIFDTVLISLYYADMGRAEVYEQYGFKVVTSGHENDANFVPRQRTLIELADYTMSNSVGTQIGYCVYLNKPHYVYKQKVNQVKGFSSKMEDEQRTENVLQAEIQEIESVFSNNTDHITQEQREMVDKYWGVKYIKPPEELKEFLTFYNY